jgi:acetylornithine/N-succinyldiaminopimelate aminotransferase
MTEKVAEKSLVPGDHGTTYGGNPFVRAAVKADLDIMEEEKIVEHAKEVSEYLVEQLDQLVETNEYVEQRRGKGLMQGLVLKKPVGDVVKQALQEGLVVISAGGNVLRMVPPLVITKEHVDEMIVKLTKALQTS